MSENEYENYEPMFELGLVEQNPAVKVIKNVEICPISLAALVTALFETVTRTIADKKQIDYEKRFLSSLKTLMRERHNYDLTIKFPDEDE